jgi:hypothetical protein
LPKYPIFITGRLVALMICGPSRNTHFSDSSSFVREAKSLLIVKAAELWRWRATVEDHDEFWGLFKKAQEF